MRIQHNPKGTDQGRVLQGAVVDWTSMKKMKNDKVGAGPTRVDIREKVGTEEVYSPRYHKASTMMRLTKKTSTLMMKLIVPFFGSSIRAGA